MGVRVHLGEDERLEAEQNGARAGGHQHQVVIGACAQLDNGPGHLPTSMSPTKGCFLPLSARMQASGCGPYWFMLLIVC